MAKKQCFIQMLLDTMSVYEDSVSKETAFSKADILEGVSKEITEYVTKLAQSTDKGYKFHMLYPSVSLLLSAEETSMDDMIHLPFMSCPVYLWEMMKQDGNNPVFQVLKYFCMSVHCIRCILAMYGVSYDVVITDSLLQEYGIVDVFDLHSYEHIFYDVFQYIE